MPRNFNKYQYETSPRKLEPEYTPLKNPYKAKKNTTRKNAINKKKRENEIKKQKRKAIKYLIIGFIILFAVKQKINDLAINFHFPLACHVIDCFQIVDTLIIMIDIK